MTHSHQFTGPKDLLGYAILDPDGKTLTLVEPPGGLPPEIVDAIHSSYHRIEVRVQFVAEHERLTIREEPAT